MMQKIFILLLALGYSLQIPLGDEPELPATTEQEEEIEEREEFFPVGECPDEDPEFGVYLADAKNCSVFYQCAHGNLHKMTCPNFLEFNPILNVCDFPERSGCVSDESSGYNSLCPLTNFSGNVKLLRDSEDNTIFYECMTGIPVLRTCPKGTIFTIEGKCEILTK